MSDQLKKRLAPVIVQWMVPFLRKNRAGSGNLPWNMADDGTPSDYCYSVWALVVTAFSLT